jgi:hypothetical protein
MALWNANIAI